MLCSAAASAGAKGKFTLAEARDISVGKAAV
jgi:hypothetical protein